MLLFKLSRILVDKIASRVFVIVNQILHSLDILIESVPRNSGRIDVPVDIVIRLVLVFLKQHKQTKVDFEPTHAPDVLLPIFGLFLIGKILTGKALQKAGNDAVILGIAIKIVVSKVH